MQLSWGLKFWRKFFSTKPLAKCRLCSKIKMRSYTSASLSYEQAIEALNRLQSNAATIQKSLAATDKHQHGENSLKASFQYLKAAELTVNDLNALSIIHVTGTKGKGSTCSFIENILRHHGLTTGFFSSPHLIAVRERIRINGVPLDCKQFTEHFWDLYDTLYSKRKHEHDMPAYFKFLTLMAFRVFLHEKVDVAIIEVGVGGQYDCTNVIRNPVVCGVSSLDIDHVNVLGNTIEEIAWNKGGIFKEGAPAFTVTQPLPAMQVLMQRAKERKTTLHLCPELTTYDWDNQQIKLGIAGKAQHLNATLALQICHEWLKLSNKSRSFTSNDQCDGSNDYLDFPPLSCPFKISPEMYSGLKHCKWPGRSQTIHNRSVTYFLDGAHTADSMKNCVEWFKEASFVQNATLKDSVCRVLIYNSTGARDPGSLLFPLSTVAFDLVIFCPNNITVNTSTSSDQANLKTPEAAQLNRCKTNQQFWSFLESSLAEKHAEYEPNEQVVYGNHINHHVKVEATENVRLAPSYILPCIEDSLLWVVHDRNPELFKNAHTTSQEQPKILSDSTRLHILVTGSLHLVGGMLSILDPELKM